MGDRDGEARYGLDPDAALGAAIRLLRERTQLSQSALASRAEIPLETIVAFELGREEPTWGTLRRIAAAVEAPLAELFQLAERLEESG
jgi:DNA-binding XRE family transcriptional regulator